MDKKYVFKRVLKRGENNTNNEKVLVVTADVKVNGAIIFVLEEDEENGKTIDELAQDGGGMDDLLVKEDCCLDAILPKVVSFANIEPVSDEDFLMKAAQEVAANDKDCFTKIIDVVNEYLRGYEPEKDKFKEFQQQIALIAAILSTVDGTFNQFLTDDNKKDDVVKVKEKIEQMLIDKFSETTFAMAKLLKQSTEDVLKKGSN